MNLFSRHKNTVVLAVLLLSQLLALAVQIRRQTAVGPVRLIRLLAVNGLAPFERMLIYSGESARAVWSDYIDLRHVRRENLRLQAEVGQMRLERAREQEDARQARRIQALLEFKQQWIDTTVAAQVIGTSGTETARLLYLDKGSSDGIKADLAVITPDGVVGKVLSVYAETAQVLLMNDPTSGVGATLVNSRLQGIVKGTSTGQLQLHYIMGDETVQPGDRVVTSGGDRVFPKGLPIGTVTNVSMGRDLFLNITVKPAADLDRLEEVLVITAQKARAPDAAGLGPIRASDILAEHLPGVPQAPPGESAPQPPPSALKAVPTPRPSLPAPGVSQKTSVAKPQTQASGAVAPKPQTAKPTAGAVTTSPGSSAAERQRPAAPEHQRPAAPEHQRPAAPEHQRPAAPALPAATPKTQPPPASEGTHPQ
ncbi:MAG: rod shape-determining protein MreC [Candidatus Korobacteraceae bacterium]|jgi:rod shape-determining protein MreC